MLTNYKVSVIIPCYNCEKYLQKTIKSLIKQTIKFHNIQVILVDDGSTDDTKNICEQYLNKYKNIEYYSQKNNGVSTARNLGIKKSLGKYIMFLDSDDYLCKQAIKKLYDFFEKHYDEVDLLTYPIYYNSNGKLKEREGYLDYNTGVYDLNKFYHFNQSTINVMVKNNKELPMFDKKLKLAEDQKFDTEVLCKKNKIGFVKEAIYYYRKSVGGASQLYNNMYYCYDSIYNYFEELLNHNKYNNKKVPRFVMSNIVNTIGWRLSEDKLFQNYLEGEEKEIMINRFVNILNKIDDEIISTHPRLNEFKKYYLFKLKKYNLFFDINEKGYKILNGDKVLIEKNSVEVVLNEVRLINENKIELLGSLNTCIFDKKKPKLYMYINDEKKEIELTESIVSYINADLKASNAYKFDVYIDITNFENIKFELKYDKYNINCNLKYRNREIDKFYFDEFCLKINSNFSISVIKTNKLKTILNIIKSSKYFSNKLIVLYKILAILIRKNEKIWLYSDSGGILDNAYYQFKHDIKKQDGVKRYYILFDDVSKVKDKLSSEELKHTIRFKSIKQKILFLNSKKIICSYSNTSNYSPFGKSLNLYEDIIKHEVIYMQHGILHANLKKMYSKELSHISKVVVSSNFELKNFVKNYGYLKEDLIPYGMPRLFIESKELKSKNKILIALSWRKYLIGDIINGKREVYIEKFKNSNFYNKIDALLNNNKLIKFIEENNIEIDFKPHPIFKPYSKLIKSKSKNISVNFDKTFLSEYKIFITDFSSYQFDYIKYKRPIIYFLPDKKEFYAGLHTYRSLDLKYEDAFGNLTTNEDELIEEIIRIYNNKLHVDSKYLSRMKNFYIKNNNKCCENIYKYIK